MDSKFLSDFLNSLSKIEKEYKAANDAKEAFENATSNILHKIELEETTYEERAKLATKLVKIRRERRKYKNKIEILEPIIMYLPEFKNTRHKFQELLGIMRKIEIKHKTRVYFPKNEKI